MPDANVLEGALSGYLRHSLDKFIFEYGIGAGARQIVTFLTPTVNSDEKEIDPFSQWRIFMNGMTGISYLPSDSWNIKGNISSGVRAPNLAELSSNGLHEGIYTYEMGNPELSNERNVNGEIGIYHFGEVFQLSVSAFYNHFFDYIYLEPTSEEWFGFPVYRFRQHDASIIGSETVLSTTPKFVKNVKISVCYTELIGKLKNGEYLPYMPAQKIKPELRHNFMKSNVISAYYFLNVDMVLEQNLVNSQEDKTPNYNLLNSGIGLTYKKEKVNYQLNISGNNFLNKAFYDHMSRFKNFGLLNIGRDIAINFKINFN